MSDIDENDWQRILDAFRDVNPKEYPDRSQIIGEMVGLYIDSLKQQPEPHAVPEAWIKCSNRMPEHMVAVFTWGVRQDKSQGGEVNWWLEPERQWCPTHTGIRVTHWMPLPKPPA